MVVILRAAADDQRRHLDAGKLIVRHARDCLVRLGELESKRDYLAAIESILGSDDEAPTTAGAWLRLLAWSLLTEPPDRSGAVQRRYATLDRLPPLLTDGKRDDASVTTAAALALVFGWRFFHPYIRTALHLDAVDFTVLQDAMRSQLHRLVDAATGF